MNVPVKLIPPIEIVTANPGQAVFDIPFTFFLASEIVCWVDGAEAVGFSVSGMGSADGGSLTLASPCVGGERVTILRVTTQKRETVIGVGGDFRADAINEELSRLAMLIQELFHRSGLCVRQSLTSVPLQLQLPDNELLPNSFLGFDAEGNLAALQGFLPTELPVSAFGASLIVTIDAAAARIVLGLDGAGAVIQHGDIGFPLARAFGGRLTLVSGSPIVTADQLAKTTIYYTPFVGDLMPIYNGARWEQKQFSELALSLDSDAGHTGYHQSGKNFDLFAVDDAGVIRLCSGPAWSSDTARGAGAGTTELTRLNGLLVNANAMTARFGAAAGNTVAVPANRASYLGSFRASANGQTQFSFGAVSAGGTEAKLFLWNMYNRRGVSAFVGDNTDSWAYSTATIRASNNSATMRVSLIVGQNDDDFDAEHLALVSGSSSVGSAGVGLDSTAAFNGKIGCGGGSFVIPCPGRYAGKVGLGFHFLSANERGNTSVAFYGDAGFAHQSGLTVTGRM